MRRRAAITVGTVGLALALVTAAACGGGGTKTVDVGNGNKVTVGKELPADFPGDFPVYAGADLQGSVQGEQGGITGLAVTWTSGDGVDDVTAFYKDAFSNGPWSSDATGSAAGATYWIVKQKDGNKAGYVSVAGGDKTTIIATVGDDASASGDTGGDATASSGSSSSDSTSSSDSSSSSSNSSSAAAELPPAVALPDGYPSDLVPIPDGARVGNAQSLSANGATTYIVDFHTKDTAKEIGDYYKQQLEGKGFTQSIQTSDANGVYAAYAENPDGTGTIVAISANDGTIEGYREAVVQITQS